MSTPPLAELLRWMTDMPAPFRGEPEGLGKGIVRVRAVVADLFESLVGAPPPVATLSVFDARDAGNAERNRLRWVLAAAHLLWHPSFRLRPPPSGAVEKLFVQDLATVASIVNVESLDQEEERREELIRRVLASLGLGLPGETTNEAHDRFQQVDSVERHRVLLAATQRERRAREVRDAMAKKAAQEAAAKVSRE